MAEIERTRVRERGTVPELVYEKILKAKAQFIDQQNMGKIVIKASSREWQQGRQGRLRFYLEPLTYFDGCLQDWRVFMHDIRTHSGKHRHQGGIVIYVLNGKGWSVVEGERVDWEKGDLLLLPMKPGGVEHQHFNADPGNPCHWVAFLYNPLADFVGCELRQVEASPDFKAE